MKLTPPAPPSWSGSFKAVNVRGQAGPTCPKALLLSGVSLQHPRGSPPTGADVNLCALPVWPARHVPCVKHPLSLFSVKLLCDVRVEILCCALLLTFGRRTEEERGGSGRGVLITQSRTRLYYPLYPYENSHDFFSRARTRCAGGLFLSTSWVTCGPWSGRECVSKPGAAALALP